MTRSFLVVTDTPGIKQFVFGTDPLAEVRGASALLDGLNRGKTATVLADALRRSGGQLVRTVYANGGTGQFVAEASGPVVIQDALAELSRFYRGETGGEVRIAYGWSEYASPPAYRDAVRAAYDGLRFQRELAFGHAMSGILPLMRECQSASHLPASGVGHWGGESLLLSEASTAKRRESYRARQRGVWAEWMRWLKQAGPWPSHDRWTSLRPEDVDEVAAESRRGGYVAMVYADGNAMGRLVQELDSVETSAAFSKIVDGSLRRACFEALAQVCNAEIETIRAALAGDAEAALVPVPADILLLGGDDLLVLLPADRALRFVEVVSARFEELTRDRIARWRDTNVCAFFNTRLQTQGFTLSFGVAMARANYPFYLLLELAEQLLKSAKKAGSADPGSGCFRNPAYVDYQLITSASSMDLETTRSRDYLTGTAHRRTLRPFAVERLDEFRQALSRLRTCEPPMPRSKLHDLFEAAMMPSRVRSQRMARELFCRCKPEQRAALWDALEGLGTIVEFPWYADRRQAIEGEADNRTYATALADLAEVDDLLHEGP